MYTYIYIYIYIYIGLWSMGGRSPALAAASFPDTGEPHPEAFSRAQIPTVP